MTKSEKSLFYFGIYVVSTGLIFLTVPEILFSLTHLPSMPTGWSSVVGLLALVIGAYDIFAAKNGIKPFIKASIYVRLGFMLGTIMLVLIGQMPLTLIILGAVDGLAAVWTAFALKSESSPS